MAYIYQITNDINQKIYIGKTEFSIEKRFKEHCRDAFKDRNEQRPLYSAMRKHGIDHFSIQLLEETTNPEEREKYWIEKTQSFKYGYNATMGGDGKKYIDYDLVIKTYNQLQNANKTAEMLNIDPSSVRKILHTNNVELKFSQDIFKERTQKTVGMFEVKTGELIYSFCSTKEAAHYLFQEGYTAAKDLDGVSSHIAKVCNGKRKTAYGYFWKYL